MQQDNSQKIIIIATLSFIAGFGLAWLIAANKDVSKEKILRDEVVISDETATFGIENTVSVQDQVEGVRVTLDKVTLKESSWVVVHEESMGKPGRILGAQLFDKGTVVSGVVDLLRGTVSGGTYYAMVHKDNGDRAFDPKYDEPITDDKGNPVMVSFRALPAQE